MSATPVDIAQVIQDAHDFDFWRTGTVDAQISKSVADFLDQLASAKIDYVVVGGIAMLAYVDGRNTKDIDLIVAFSRLQGIPNLIVTYQDRDFARATYRGLQIDVLKSENRLFDLVRNKHSTMSKFAGRTIRLATPEGLVRLKLYALPSLYRQGIFDRVALYETDITMLMQRYPIKRAEITTTLKNFLSENDMASLEEILNEIEIRIRRFRERPQD